MEAIISMDNQNIVIIKPKRQNTLLLFVLLFIVIPAVTYYFFRQTAQKSVYWIDVGLFIFLWAMLIVAALNRLSYIIRGKNIYNELMVKLTPQGFYKGDTLYKWNDIDCFGVKREYTTLFSPFFDRRIVYWKYKPASSSRHFKRNFIRFFSGYDDALSTKYDIEPDALVKLLNEWKLKYSGQSSEIEFGVGLNRKLTTKEVVFALAFTLFLIFVIVAITALYITK